MNLSIIIPVLDSHEIVRRQLAHFDRIGLPDDTELILVDDGSTPPHIEDRSYLRILRTRDYRPWTWALARNRGAREAYGRRYLMTDIDHILSRDLIDYCAGYKGQKIQFKREFGVLLEDGTFTQDHQTLMAYGLPAERIANKGARVPPLPNNFSMRRDIFWELGGYREDLFDRPYPQGEDRLFKKAWQNWIAAGKGQVDTYRPTVYMFPGGYYCGDVDHNPFGLFHDLTRKTRRNHAYMRRRGLADA